MERRHLLFQVDLQLLSHFDPLMLGMKDYNMKKIVILHHDLHLQNLDSCSSGQPPFETRNECQLHHTELGVRLCEELLTV
mmetsp:Transcript_43280/g.115782  ORF Transcript_43280/g.115782 Transcript_43280/m.115782 type:complete len:80 (-) Transcript_43280:1513-1752(-)